MITIPSFSDDIQRNLAKKWLLLAISSLALAGLFSLPPVILRGPFFANILPVEHIFSVSLVVHVDLSVLVWMFAMMGVVWSYTAEKSTLWINKTAFYLALAGMILITISVFFPNARPLKNNYVPMLQNFPFIFGLSCFFCGIVLQSILTIYNWKLFRLSIIHFSGLCAALISISTALGFVFAARILPTIKELGAHDFYELLFWGGGHIFQFVATTLLIVSWLWISKKNGLIGNNVKLWVLIFSINTILVLPLPVVYLFTDNIDDLTPIFTDHMIKFGGVAPLLAGILIVIESYKNRKQDKSIDLSIHYLILSLALFGYGGILGYMISGVNASIPAHYHGSIVGITLGLMGIALILFPKVGFSEPGKKMAITQAYIYGIGQICHISGLALMGGYGALRKAPGSSLSVDTMLGKAMFFSGGAMAILGGLLFIVISYKAIFSKKS